MRYANCKVVNNALWCIGEVAMQLLASGGAGGSELFTSSMATPPWWGEAVRLIAPSVAHLGALGGAGATIVPAIDAALCALTMLLQMENDLDLTMLLENFAITLGRLALIDALAPRVAAYLPLILIPWVRSSPLRLSLRGPRAIGIGASEPASLRAHCADDVLLRLPAFSPPPPFCPQVRCCRRVEMLDEKTHAFQGLMAMISANSAALAGAEGFCQVRPLSISLSSRARRIALLSGRAPARRHTIDHGVRSLVRLLALLLRPSISRSPSRCRRGMPTIFPTICAPSSAPSSRRSRIQWTPLRGELCGPSSRRWCSRTFCAHCGSKRCDASPTCAHARRRN